MRAAEAAGQVKVGTSTSQDPRFKGKGRALGGETGVGGGKRGTGGLPSAEEEIMRMLGGLNKVDKDAKQADGVMVSCLLRYKLGDS
jgi:hypothetical protein